MDYEDVHLETRPSFRKTKVVIENVLPFQFSENTYVSVHFAYKTKNVAEQFFRKRGTLRADASRGNTREVCLPRKKGRFHH